jgi:hypothetical protein
VECIIYSIIRTKMKSSEIAQGLKATGGGGY